MSGFASALTPIKTFLRGQSVPGPSRALRVASTSLSSVTTAASTPAGRATAAPGRAGTRSATPTPGRTCRRTRWCRPSPRTRELPRYLCRRSQRRHLHQRAEQRRRLGGLAPGRQSRRRPDGSHTLRGLSHLPKSGPPGHLRGWSQRRHLHQRAEQRRRLGGLAPVGNPDAGENVPTNSVVSAVRALRIASISLSSVTTAASTPAGRATAAPGRAGTRSAIPTQARRFPHAPWSFPSPEVWTAWTSSWLVTTAASTPAGRPTAVPGRAGTRSATPTPGRTCRRTPWSGRLRTPQTAWTFSWSATTAASTPAGRPTAVPGRAGTRSATPTPGRTCQPTRLCSAVRPQARTA